MILCVIEVWDGIGCIVRMGFERCIGVRKLGRRVI